jgi:hypothetical protein
MPEEVAISRISNWLSNTVWKIDPPTTAVANTESCRYLNIDL